LTANDEIDFSSYPAVNCSIVSLKIFSGDGRHKLIWGNFIHPPTIMMRKSACKKVGELKRNIPTQEDWEYFFRISKYGKIAWIDYPLLQYRLHSQQMSSTSNAVKNAKGIVLVFEGMLEKEPVYAKENERDVRKMLGRFCASAAYTLIEVGEKPEAIGYLKKSFRCNPLILTNYKLLVKWLLS
jgi:two-component SAPR family response regulator